MTIGANTLRLLMEAGLEGDALLAVVSSIEADTAPKHRSNGAERQARYRARNNAAKRLGDAEWLPLVGKVVHRDGKCQYCGSTERLGADHVLPLSRGGSNDLSNLVACCESCNKSKGGRTVQEWRSGTGPRHGDVTSNVTLSVTDDAPRVGAARVEDNSQTSVEEPQDKKQSAKRNDLDAFRAELSSLDTERLESLIKHRRAKKGQLTGHAARLFRRDADACGLTLSEAVDTCISRNWITVKADWLTGNQRTGPPGTGPSRPPSQADVFKFIGENAANGRQEYEDRSGVGAVVSYLPTVRSG